MKIGLLAYHAACNYGAFLQLLSTVEYLKKRGHEPRVINWVPRDFKKYYEKTSHPDVRKVYADMRALYYPMTRLCETAKEVAAVIEEENIKAVIVGSDAVLQHHPFRERFKFPCRRIIYISHPTSDRMYPNCFWGEFNNYLRFPVPIMVISGSSQDSKYYFITGKTKKKMKSSILSFNYISVRDEWTQKMIEYLTDGGITPEVTPDPVFGFNLNASELLPSKTDILEKFNLPQNYMIVSFRGVKSVNQEWITEFEQYANSKGVECVKLPYADMEAFGSIQHFVGNRITPLEWYALIKYSKGYVGNNMHPIVTSIVNNVPFFSFDYYGIPTINGKSTDGETSKVYHILSIAGLLDNRVFTLGAEYEAPTPKFVYEKIENFDIEKEHCFAKDYLEKYKLMMNKVCELIEN